MKPSVTHITLWADLRFSSSHIEQRSGDTRASLLNGPASRPLSTIQRHDTEPVTLPTLRLRPLPRMGNNTDTTIVHLTPGDSHPARGMRLRLRFEDRELLVDERHSSVTIGRAVDNDMVMKGHLISRLHARIEITHNKFLVLVDQSTNGTFVQSADGEELFLRHDSMQLKGQGLIGLGRVPERGTAHTVHFICEEV